VRRAPACSPFIPKSVSGANPVTGNRHQPPLFFLEAEIRGIAGSRRRPAGVSKRLEAAVRLLEGSIRRLEAVIPLLEASRRLLEPSGRRLEVVISRLTVVVRMRTCGTSVVAPSRKPHPNAHRLATPAVRRKMLDVIGKQVGKSDADDVAQAAFLVLLKMVAELPEAEPELLALVTVVTKRRLLDFFRHRAVREGRDAGIEDVEEAPVSDGSISLEARADWAKMLGLVEEEIERGNIPPDVLRWARGLSEGKTIDEMADEEKVSPSKIKMALKRAREKLQPLWEEKMKIGGVLIVAFLCFLFFPRRGPAPEIHRDSDDMGAPTAPSSTASSEPDAAPLTPDAYRAIARDACTAHDWGKCQQALNRAAEQDIDSEQRPDVIALRKAIDKAARDSVRKQ
jgi:DNA-directed RNA polymerase specialized sigma24 family protein